jgi:hypothetical protein
MITSAPDVLDFEPDVDFFELGFETDDFDPDDDLRVRTRQSTAAIISTLPVIRIISPIIIPGSSWLVLNEAVSQSYVEVYEINCSLKEC